MLPYIVPVDDDMIMFDHIGSYGSDNFMDQFILCLEEELQSGLSVRSSTRQARPPQTKIEADEKIVSVDTTRRTPTRTNTRTRRRPSHSRSCGSQSSSSSSSSSLGGGNKSTRSLRSREPTIADFLKATGQNMEDISFSDLRKYTDRNFVRLAEKWGDSAAAQNVLQEEEQQQDELLVEVSVYLDDDLEHHENDDASNSLDISLCENSLNENDEEDLLLKALLNSDCVKREVEGTMSMSNLEAEEEHSMRSTLTGGILSLGRSIVGFMNIALQKYENCGLSTKDKLPIFHTKLHVATLNHPHPLPKIELQLNKTSLHSIHD
jgi:hypothetical protein